MSDPDRDALSDLLELATDRVEASTSTRQAWGLARRRRARRAGLGAGAAVALVLVGGLVLTDLARTPSADRAPATTSSPTPTPTPAPSKAPASPPTADTRPAPVRRLDPSIVQERWDPRGVDQLPPASAEITGSLPEVAQPPATSPALADDPIGVAVAVVPDVDGTSAQLLGTSGEWRSVELLGRNSQAALSPRGTRLLVRSVELDGQASFAVDDLATGSRRALPQPEGYEPQDFSRVRWLDEERFLLDDGTGGWVIDASSGEASQVPYPTHFRWAVDGSGEVVEVTGGPPRSAAVVDWRSGESRAIANDVTGALESVDVSEDQIAGTALRLTPDDVVERSTTAAYAVVVADRRTGTPSAALSVLDFDGNYSGGGLGVAAVREDGLVLLRVSVFGSDGGDRLVAWDPGSGALTLAARFLVGIRQVDFAQALLTEVGP